MNLQRYYLNNEVVRRNALRYWANRIVVYSNGFHTEENYGCKSENKHVFRSCHE